MPGGSNHNRYRMRCSRGASGCGRRFTLRRHPDLYQRSIRCPHCSSDVVINIEQERRNEAKQKAICHCYNYPFPHEKGTLRMCIHHPKAGQNPTDEEYYEYQRCLDTPRSDVS